jgi:hypothetical protein
MVATLVADCGTASKPYRSKYIGVWLIGVVWMESQSVDLNLWDGGIV